MKRRVGYGSVISQTFDHERLTAEDARDQTLVDLLRKRKLLYAHDETHPTKRARKSAPSMFKARSH
jgi:hypothetical protein